MEAIYVVFDTLPVVVDDLLDGRVREQFCVTSSPEDPDEVTCALGSSVQSWDVEYLERHLPVLHTLSEKLRLKLFGSTNNVNLLDTVGTRTLDLVHDGSFCSPNLALRRWNVHSFILTHSSVKEVSDAREVLLNSCDD